MLYIKNEEAEQFYTMGTAIALGKFDGIHLGHQALINGLAEEKKKGRQALVFTFGAGLGAKKNIYTQKEKAYYFSKIGIDVLLEYPFTKEFASLTPEDFVKECLVKRLGVCSVYVGADFHFGCGRSGNVALLEELGKEYGFCVHAIEKCTMHGKVISSTTIRDMLETHFYIANEMLGNPYFVYGEVIHGNHLGRTIGFPTINQEVSAQKLIPAFGVYASRILIDDVYYRGISNLGIKPTVQNERNVGLETYILDFEGDLYGRELQTELLYFIRPEEKFDNIDALKQQILNDISGMLEQEI